MKMRFVVDYIEICIVVVVMYYGKFLDKDVNGLNLIF